MSTPSSIHQSVRAVTGDYLSLVDEFAPGLVEGLYLYGSVALNDFRPGQSDIDFVAVTADTPTTTQLASLRRTHIRLSERHRRPYLDGAYVTWAELGSDPAAAAGPHVHEHGFTDRSRAERHLVTWHSLVQCGVSLRGPSIPDVKVCIDPDGLEVWVLGNIDLYWLPLWRRMSNLPTWHGLASFTPTQAVWAVLGVTRMHYTVATGRITSKYGAGEYALSTFDGRWHRVIEECMRIRSGATGPSRYGNPYRRRSDMLAYVDMVLKDAKSLG